MNKKYLLSFLLTLVLSGCGTNIKQDKSTYNEQIVDYTIEGSLSNSQKSELVLFSLNLLDTKYNWGGKKPNFGLDCSGLVSYVFNKSINIKLNGAARDIVKKGKNVPIKHAIKNKLEPGDLLFFNTTGKPHSHVGIYIGNNSFLHASSGKGKVILSSMNNKYYAQRLHEIKRI